jgi:hypothetical protein
VCSSDLVGFACILASQYLSRRLKQTRLNLIYRKKGNRFPDDFIHPNAVNENNAYIPSRLNFYSYNRSKKYALPVQYEYNYNARAKLRPEPPFKPDTGNRNIPAVNMKRLAGIRAEKFIRQGLKKAAVFIPILKYYPEEKPRMHVPDIILNRKADAPV